MIPKKVIFCLRGGVGGVDVFATNLIEEFLRNGVEAKIILTTRARSFLPDHLEIDELPIQRGESWPSRWRKMIHYLENQSPCIFLPNYEHDYAVISPKLSEKIVTVGIVHSDENIYYDDVARLGKFWNGIIAVSDEIANHVTSLNQSFSGRLKTIPYGVPLPESFPVRTYKENEPLKIVYVGRLAQLQKRILDLPLIFQKLMELKVNFEITIIGEGYDRSELFSKCETLIPKDRLHFLGAMKNQDVLKTLPKYDVILLTSDFEGMPIAILEGMGRGCVPVVSATRSGIPELVKDGQNGFIVRIGDIKSFADRLSLLQSNLQTRKDLSLRAYETIRDHYNLRKMAQDYLDFFQELQVQINRGLYRRPKGSIVSPPTLKLSWKQYLPNSLRSAGFYAKRLLRHKRFN